MSDDTIEKLVLLLLGWLLGLLAPVIVDSIKRRRENKLGRAAIRVELIQLRERLIIAAHSADDHLGTQTKEKIRWTLERLHAREDDKIRPALEMRINQADAEFNALVAYLAGKGNQSIRLQNYGTPLLDARVSALWSFNTEAQRLLLQLKTEMGFLDDAVTQSRFFNELTFKELPSLNHQIAVQSVREYIDTYAQRARKAVELIDRFL
ncbi:hypothetical protein [Acidovorax sp. JHL-9]|uniref:hypothetical protein n=1 Tax=Acidovorax sp. JHL-9 TaxID=1276756 RepID=UPI00047AD828|nr:hypothetical protein [Acidovorax sp. JHL-9]